MSRKGNTRAQAEAAPQNRPENRGAQQQPVNRTGNGHEKESGTSRDESSGNSIFSSDEIAERAYQIFEREGRVDGRDMDHWLQAERELRMERERRSEGERLQRDQRGGAMTPENAPRSARQHQQQQR